MCSDEIFSEDKECSLTTELLIMTNAGFFFSCHGSVINLSFEQMYTNNVDVLYNKQIQIIDRSFLLEEWHTE